MSRWTFKGCMVSPMRRKTHAINHLMWGTGLFLTLSLYSACSSDAFSIEAPSVVNMTAQPSVLTRGETVVLDFYSTETLPVGQADFARRLDTESVENIGLEVLGWQFRAAFEFSIQVAVPDGVPTGVYNVEIPIANEFADFMIQFQLQIIQ